MDKVSKTLFIPPFGKAQVSRKNIILRDPMAEKIWEREAFPIAGKAKSKWLAYFMAMRARVFDDWTDAMLRQRKDALVLHIGCGLDSRCLRVKEKYAKWIDVDLPDVILQRRHYFADADGYAMAVADVSNPADIMALPDSPSVIVIMEGVSMYLTNGELAALLRTLRDKYADIYLMMDTYTEIAAKMSKYRNPISEVGVTKVYGVPDVEPIAAQARLRLKREHSFTPDALIDELEGFDRAFFKTMYAGALTTKLYRLFELETRD